MKQYTTPEQTAKLIELGFRKPKSIETMIIQPVVDGYVHLVPQQAYSIGELIEIIAGIEVDKLSICRYGKYWSVTTDLRTGCNRELIEALYAMVVYLKEIGVI